MTDTTTPSGPRAVTLPDELSVINIGLELFGEALRAQAVPVQDVEWRIPANGDAELIDALEILDGPRSRAIDEANTEVVRRLDESTPMLVAIGPARDHIPGMPDRTLLHCGPPITWPEVVDPLRRSMRAATVAEGWAADVEEADRLLAAGAIALAPAMDHDTVIPMASSMGPSSPVFVVENAAGGTTAFSAINQGPGETAWFGRDTPAAVARLEFLREIAGPLLARALDTSGPIDLFSLAAQGVHMGDDVHMRTQGTTALLIRHLLPHLTELPREGRADLARFLSGNHLFFLNLAMAAAKSAALWSEQVDGSSVITVMSRNGSGYAVRLAGRDELFTSSAPPVSDAMYYPGHGPEDAAPDIGDSAILELVGLGGAAAAGSPAVAGFLGGSMAGAIAVTEDMARICVTRSTRFTLPTWDGSGTPLGVDARRVVETGVTPHVTTGILHASSGVGQIGAGVAIAPVECFRDAVRALASS